MVLPPLPPFPPPVDAPLPSVRSARGREEFLQTPAYVIAAHYTRGDTLRSQAQARQLREKLKQTAVYQVRGGGLFSLGVVQEGFAQVRRVATAGGSSEQ